MSDQPDRQEVIKKPSAGLSYSRKLNTGQDYENEELELWGTTGSLDSLDYDDFRENLSTLVDEVVDGSPVTPKTNRDHVKEQEVRD